MFLSRRFWLLVFVIAVAPTVAIAEDFRIETRVYEGKSKDIVSQNLTLFRTGVVYDYLTEPPQVAIFDKARGRFKLLDPVRKLRTEVSTEAVLEVSQELQLKAAKAPTAFLKFAAHPTFDPELDDKTGQLTMASKTMTYTLTTVKAHSDDAAQQYREFSDWYARLNAMTNPAAMPPFARLAVNAELARRGLMAEKVVLDIPSQLQRPGQNLRSEHRIAYRLLPKDMEKIEETAKHLHTFTEVSLKEFRDKSKH